MDAVSIDVQVLSLAIPGLQADIDAPAARDDVELGRGDRPRFPRPLGGRAGLPQLIRTQLIRTQLIRTQLQLVAEEAGLGALRRPSTPSGTPTPGSAARPAPP